MDRVQALRRQQHQVGSQGGPGIGVGEVGDDAVCGRVEARDLGWAESMLGGDVEGVQVAVDLVGQLVGRVVGLAAHRRGGGGGGVAGQDRLEQVGRGAGVGVVGSDDVVLVAVADDLEI